MLLRAWNQKKNTESRTDATPRSSCWLGEDFNHIEPQPVRQYKEGQGFSTQRQEAQGKKQTGQLHYFYHDAILNKPFR